MSTRDRGPRRGRHRESIRMVHTGTDRLVSRVPGKNDHRAQAARPNQIRQIYENKSIRGIPSATPQQGLSQCGAV